MCSIGKFLKDTCDKTSHTSKIGRQQIEDLTNDDIQILSRRCGLDQDQLTDVCLHHLEVYLFRYSRNHTNCCNPYSSHKRTTKSAPNGEITLATSLKCEEQGLQLKLVPGQKLCKRCHEKVHDALKTKKCDNVTAAAPPDTEADDANDEDYVPEGPSGVPPVCQDSPRQELNMSLSELGVSPLRMHGVHATNRVAHGKRKMEKVHVAQEAKSHEVAVKVARALDVSPEQLSSFKKDAEYDTYKLGESQNPHNI